jgi:polysaccharide export outer membrane protein
MEDAMRHLLPTLIAFVLLAGCNTLPDQPTANSTSVFKPAEKSEKIEFLDREALAAFEAPVSPVYRLGEGDHISVQVWGRPELSQKHVVGPDGHITLPLAGPLRIAETTREEAAGRVTESFQRYYRKPAVTIAVDQYTANRVVVLGRVQNPGSITFDRPPTLLEALARAGSLPVIDKQATLTRCAVFRGREQVIWVDLKHLLNRGDSAYNIRLKPGDLVYIPDSFDTLVYVMGAVHKPGAYRLTPDMSLLDALAQAGGPNEDANHQEITIYRAGRQAVEKAPLSALVSNSPKRNFALEEGDVVYVSRSGIAEVGYVMRQLLPGLGFLTFGLAAAGPR